MKKILLMLVAVLTLAFVGCGNRQTTKTADVTEVEVVETDDCACCDECNSEVVDEAEVVETVEDAE